MLISVAASARVFFQDLPSVGPDLRQSSEAICSSETQESDALLWAGLPLPVY